MLKSSQPLHVRLNPKYCLYSVQKSFEKISCSLELPYSMLHLSTTSCRHWSATPCWHLPLHAGGSSPLPPCRQFPISFCICQVSHRCSCQLPTISSGQLPPFIICSCLSPAVGSYVDVSLCHQLLVTSCMSQDLNLNLSTRLLESTK